MVGSIVGPSPYHRVQDPARSHHQHQVNIDHCIHTVSGALGSASNIDNMMSMKNVGEGIRGVVAALKSDSDFAGALAALDDQGFADLDKRIQSMQKSSSKLAKLAV